MIGLIHGEVVFSDGNDLILLTNSGIGHEIYFAHVLPEGSRTAIFISHVVKEASEELYGFKTLREKKMFEMLTTVKGVGPKSAFSLVASVGSSNIVDAIMFENKKVLTKAPGIGAKAASQMVLDLSGKVQKIKMYSNRSYSVSHNEAQVASSHPVSEVQISFDETEHVNESAHFMDETVLRDTLMACKELGFKEEKIIPLAQKILNENEITKPEQLVHLVLKEV